MSLKKEGFVKTPVTKHSLSKRKPLHGVGINDCDYMVHFKVGGKKYICPFYTVWANMIKRCYSKSCQRKQKTYLGCSVSNEWKYFSNFRKWMIKQDWKDMELDKDIKIIGNKEYSENSCIFVTNSINSLFLDHAGAKGDCPTGVYLENRRGKFVARCSVNGKQKFIGYYSSAEEAKINYNKFKVSVITDAASRPENLYIKQYLLNHAELLK